jgi:hypothetical protein
MKKLLPYALQMLMLAALIFMSIELLMVKKELVLLRNYTLSVEVVNTPSVSVDNDPDVHIRP